MLVFFRCLFFELLRITCADQFSCFCHVEEIPHSAWVAEHTRKWALRDSHIPKGKIPREPFWSFTEDMDMYSGDCPRMANQISRGILTEASFKSISEACPDDESLVAKVSEHAAHVCLRPLPFLSDFF